MSGTKFQLKFAAETEQVSMKKIASLTTFYRVVLETNESRPSIFASAFA